MQWEPKASQSPPGFRRATCVKCGRPMTKMWHIWFNQDVGDGRTFVKELHMCRKCGRAYEA